MSLKELQDSVEADAALHLPDIKYDSNSIDHEVKFEAILMSDLIDKDEVDVAGLRISTDRQEILDASSNAYAFSRWSRSQLLTLLGTRERWFDLVGLDQQVAELNVRMHALSTYRIRTMKAVDEDFPIRLVRGLVSSAYSEIKNTEIMAAVIAKAHPDSRVLRFVSGVSDRAFYAYIMSPTPIIIPGMEFVAYPGVIVKNSEVGYTSLWVIPTLVMKKYGAPIVFEAQHVLKRVHRGKADLAVLFEKAFQDCTLTWAALAQQIPSLVSKTFGTEDMALARVNGILARIASKEFILLVNETYKAKPRTHTALDIFEAVVEACSTYTDRDETYAVGAIAGTVLYNLLT